MANPLKCVLLGYHTVYKKYRAVEIRYTKVSDNPDKYNYVYPCHICGLYVNRKSTFGVTKEHTIIGEECLDVKGLMICGIKDDKINWVD